MRKKQTLNRILKIELILLVPVLIAAVLAVCHDLSIRPGKLDANALEIESKTADEVSLKWKPVKNADTYKLSYREKGSSEWTTLDVSGDTTEAKIKDLDEGTEYEFSLKADNDEMEGDTAATAKAATKKHQTISGKKKQMKLAGSDKLNLSAETEIALSSEDDSIVDVEGDSVRLKPGTATIKAQAAETDEYVSEETEVEVEVLDSVSEDPEDADMHILYRLSEDNCERVQTVKGADGATVPQGFAYVAGDYIIAYGMDKPQRFVQYRSEGEPLMYIPGMDLGHPNGFAWRGTAGYSVRGYSTKCVICELDEDKYSAFDLKYSASGIAYDIRRDMFYTSSITTLVSYTADFEVDKVMPVIRRSGKYYNQDCGGHAGIMMRCISGEDKHGINYVDLYDMINCKYLGSVECELSEVESAAVDDDGYMLLLCNTTKAEDYIYRTPINIDDLGADL